MACICSWLFVALACTLVLDLRLWRISAQETRGPCGPLMGTAALTVEECFRAHTVSTFLSDAPHASHTHEKLQTFTAPAGLGKEIRRRRERSTNRKTWWRAALRMRWKACVHEGNANKNGSICDDCMCCRDMWVSWRPLRAPLRGFGGPQAKLFAKEPQGPRRGWLEHTCLCQDHP